MLIIDERLCDSISVPELIEDLNRILALIDALDERVKALEPTDEPT